MERSRRFKVLSIIALVLAIAGMSLGFAAFSSTLSISSSATVTPNSDDFKIKIYGYNQKKDFETLVLEQSDTLNDLNFYSDVQAQPINFDDYSSGTIASIDNSTLSIGNISVNLPEPDDGVFYFFYLKNDGKYDAYLDLTKYASGFGKTCIPSTDVTQDLFDAACKLININIGLFKDINGEIVELNNTESTYYQLKAGDYVLLLLDVGHYLGVRADGDFSVEFYDIELEFTTAPPSN